MSEIIVARFPDTQTAVALRKALQALARDYTIEAGDIEIVRKDARGRVSRHGEVNLPLAQTIGGAAWGGVLGMVFLMPVIGAVVGAGVGYVTGRSSDVGLSNDYLDEVGGALAPGEAAVALLARKLDGEAVRAQIARFDGEIIRSSLKGGNAAQIDTWDRHDPHSEKADMRDQPTLA